MRCGCRSWFCPPLSCYCEDLSLGFSGLLVRIPFVAFHLSVSPILQSPRYEATKGPSSGRDFPSPTSFRSEEWLRFFWFGSCYAVRALPLPALLHKRVGPSCLEVEDRRPLLSRTRLFLTPFRYDFPRFFPAFFHRSCFDGVLDAGPDAALANQTRVLFGCFCFCSEGDAGFFFFYHSPD